MIILDYFENISYLYIRDNIHESFLNFILEKEEILHNRDIDMYYFTKESADTVKGVKVLRSIKTLARIYHTFSMSPIIVFVEDESKELDYMGWGRQIFTYKLSSKEDFIKETLKKLMMSGENIDYHPQDTIFSLYSPK